MGRVSTVQGNHDSYGLMDPYTNRFHGQATLLRPRRSTQQVFTTGRGISALNQFQQQ
jgi:hypothetical protein